jgi:hypothetical protein
MYGGKRPGVPIAPVAQERAIETCQTVVGPARRNGRAGLEADVVLQHAAFAFAQRRALLAGLGIFDIDHKGDVGGDVARHAPRRGVEVPLEEDIRGDAEQQDHRRYDDEQRTPEQPARQKALDEPPGIVTREPAQRLR